MKNLFGLFSFLTLTAITNFMNAQWTMLNQTFPNQKVICVTALGNDLYVGTSNQYPNYGKIYRSSNNGVNWVVIDSSYGGYFKFLKSGNAIFVSTSFGVLRSTDNGVTFNQVLTTNVGGRMALINSKLLVVTYQGVIYRSSDNGTTWQTVKNGTSTLWVSNIAVTGNTVFIAGYGIIASVDDGATWTSKPALQDKLINSLFSNGPALFVSIYDTILRSLDNGVTWANVTGNLVALSSAYDLSFGKYNSRILCATPAGLYASKNNGQNW